MQLNHSIQLQKYLSCYISSDKWSLELLITMIQHKLLPEAVVRGYSYKIGKFLLKSVHFKKTVARISFLSKLWYFLFWFVLKVPHFWKKRDSRNWLLIMNRLYDGIGIPHFMQSLLIRFLNRRILLKRTSTYGNMKTGLGQVLAEKSDSVKKIVN